MSRVKTYLQNCLHKRFIKDFESTENKLISLEQPCGFIFLHRKKREVMH